MTRALAVLVLCLSLVPDADASRRRAVRATPNPTVDATTPSGWLAAHAYPLRTTDLTTDTSDLEPLRSIVGSADVVGLGDGTHGTREFYTIKLRVIDYLVRELGFELISFEGSFPLFEKINAYIQGGPGDPRALLAEAGRLGYHFWDTEEILAVIEWMRQYNAHRGARPLVQIAGADIWEPRSAAEQVIAYLRTVDPSAVAAAESDYRCVLAVTGLFPLGCTRAEPDSALARLSARRADLGIGSGAAAFELALQYARVITQSFTFAARDQNMAANVRWLREHRASSGRVVYWAHSEHAGKLASEQAPAGSAGSFLARDLGNEYVAIGTSTGSGGYITWLGSGPTVFPVPEPEAGTYEMYFQLGARPAVLIPMQRNVPQWLSTPARYFFAAAAPGAPYLTASLPLKFDALIYVHATTPIRLLQH